MNTSTPARAAERAHIAPILLTAEEAAAFLGIGETAFHSQRGAPWMPQPVVLGPRLLRWSRAELESAVSGMPRQKERSEPAQLARGKIERMKGH